MEFVYNDGGRGAAGFKGKTGDCVCRSIAIITGETYREVYNSLNVLAKAERKPRGKSSARNGVRKITYNKYLTSLGMKWTPTMLVGQGCKVHLADGELPKGKLIVRLSKHMTAVINGVIHDTHDPQRCTIIREDGIDRIAGRCVYGYWQK